MGKYMLTTFDNPYNPFTEFKDWFVFDNLKGYNTCGKLARIADTSESISEEDEDEAIELAMDELISSDPLNLFRKVTEESFKNKNEDLEELKRAIEAREEPRNKQEAPNSD